MIFHGSVLDRDHSAAVILLVVRVYQGSAKLVLTTKLLGYRSKR